MNWDTLLSTWRLAPVEEEPEAFDRYPINAFEKDYAAIVSSPAFRRLQDKTQVFPLDKSDFVRTRLTHSIEVSTVARQLGVMLVQNFRPYRPDALSEEAEENIPTVLMCAGLLHDLGNPPFGHFGEALIGEWFREHLDTISYKGKPLRSYLTKQMARDLEYFEGNAQALRILCKARYRGETNLSAAVIGTLIKYPTDSLSFEKKDPDIKKHKLGYYTAEAEIFGQLTDTLGMKTADGVVCRHPLTYLMEAADDIAYATADLEDALKKGLFTLDEFIRYYRSGYKADEITPRSPADYTERQIRELEERRGEVHTPESDARAFKVWLDRVRSWLMYTAVYRFSNSYDEILAGTFQEDLFYETNHSLTISLLKKTMAEYAYDSAGILRLELAAHSTLTFLLDHLVHAVLYYDPEYRDKGTGCVPTSADEKYLRIIPEDYLQDYKSTRTGDEKTDLYLRLLIVTDFLSGMTDSYARTLYREVSGIE